MNVGDIRGPGARRLRLPRHQVGGQARQGRQALRRGPGRYPGQLRQREMERQTKNFLSDLRKKILVDIRM